MHKKTEGWPLKNSRIWEHLLAPTNPLNLTNSLMVSNLKNSLSEKKLKNNSLGRERVNKAIDISRVWWPVEAGIYLSKLTTKGHTKSLYHTACKIYADVQSLMILIPLIPVLPAELVDYRLSKKEKSFSWFEISREDYIENEKADLIRHHSFTPG